MVPDDNKTRFANHPWLALPDAALATADPVFTMLHQDERKLYYWLAAEHATAAGATVDLGAYFGGSTACLAAGFAARGITPAIHAYDRFRVKNHTRKARLLDRGIPDFRGSDALPAVQSLLAPWGDQITLHAGDIRRQLWPGDPVELLIVDAAKHGDTTDHIADQFFASLIPGHSIVLHQDFLHDCQPWIAAQMALFADHFEPLALCHRETLVFLCTRAITKSDIAQRRVMDLDAAAYVAQISAMADRLSGFDIAPSLERLIEVAQKFPMIRSSHSLNAALRS